MPSALRSALRDHTSASHARLDARVGPLDGDRRYRDYLRGTFAFRTAIERRLAGAADWQLESLAPMIADDLDDLGLARSAIADFAGLPATRAHEIGAAYVAEGSALGARILVRQAAILGMTDGHGARHLAHQAADKGRWPAFLDVLDKLAPEQHVAALEGAQLTFGVALAAYTGEFA